MNKKFVFPVFSYLICGFFALYTFAELPAAESSIHSNREFYVKNIHIEMLSQREVVDPKHLLLSLKTKQGDVFSQDTFDKDLKFLADKYHRVEPKVEYKGKEVHLHLKLWPRKLLKEIVFEGNQKFDSKLLRKQLAVKDAVFFDRVQFTEEFRKLRIFYLKKGFYNSHLSFKEVYVQDTDEVKILIKVDEGKPGFIKSIVIKGEGVSSKEEQEILDTLYTKTYFFLTSWITSNGLYQQEAMDQDLLKVTSYYQNLGYADVKVKGSVEEVPGKSDRISIIIEVEKGEKYQLKHLKIKGNTLYTTAALKPLLETQEGEYYSPQKVYNSSENIRKEYGKKGYVDCRVAQNIEIDGENRLYEVEFNIHEGKPYRIGLVKVFGNERTKTSVILHENLLTPGDWFDVRKIEATENNLMAMDYFKSVNVYTVDGESSFGASFKDVHIDVEEKTTGKFGLFGAYSQQEKLVGGLSFMENNFNLRGVGDLPSEGIAGLRGGGENLFAKFSWGVQDRQSTLAWAKPHFLDTPWTFRLEGDYHYSRLTRDQENKVRSLSVFGIYNLNAFLRTQIFYKIKDARSYIQVETSRLSPSRYEERNHARALYEASASGLTEASVRAELAADPNYADKTEEELDTLAESVFYSRAHDRYYEPLKDEIINDSNRGDGVTSIIGGGLIYDSTNHPVYPTKGLFSNLSAEFAGIGGDHRFFKINYENTHYYDITEKLIMKSRWDLQFILPFKKDNFVPFNERFFLGGDFSIRGYKGSVLGPRYTAHSPGGMKIISSLAKGGLSSTLLSSEIDYKLNQYLVPFAFLDVGNLNDKKFHIGALKYFKASAGIGTQLHLMPSMPPFVVGWGFPIKPDNKKDDVSNFFFSIGMHF